MQTPLAPLSFFKAIFLAAGSGVLLSLAFPEINLYPLALVAPLLLFLAIYGQNGKTAFFLGWVQGLWLGVFSLYWLPKVLTVYGALPGWGANLIFLILVSYLALYPATFAWLILPLKPSSGKGALLYPLSLAFLWTGLEWLKNYIFTGFNWTPLSAALGAAPKWLGAADLVGVYGLNFLISFIPFSVGTYLILRFGHVKSPLNPKSLLALVVTPLLVLGFLYGYGSYSYNYWEEKTADYPTHRISLIQASVEQEEKWDEKFRFKIFERYSSLVQNAKQTNPDLIIWSETAAPFIYGRDPYETSWLNNLADETGIPMLVGLTADFFSPKEGYHLRNRLWLIYPMAEAKYPYRLGPFYDKKHLVPFGEYVPLEKTFPFLKAPFFQGVIGAAGDYSPGEPVPPLDFQGLDLGPLICFESVFPYLAREKASQGADLLVVSTNDAWFGKSYAPAQHFNHSIARAVETRKPLVRAANNGISGLIHPSGRVVYRSPLNAIFTIPLEVPVSQHKNFTWYTRAGWIIAPLTGIGVAFFLLTRIVFSLPFLRKSKTLKPSRHSTKTPHSSTKSPHSSTKSQASVNFKPSRKVRAPLNPNRKKKRKKR